MKLNLLKTFFVLCISALVGLVCFSIAKEGESRNWISFGVTAATCAVCLIAAFGIEYKSSARGLNMKVAAWLGVPVVLAANVVFSFFEYSVMTYLTVVLLITIIILAGLVGMSKPEKEKK